MSESKDVVVIGAGLSGLMGAIESARRGLSVLVLEGAPQIGARYCYTGMGAAPVSNVGMAVDRFHGRNARFVDDAISAFALPELRDWFHREDVALQDAPYYGLVQPVESGPSVVAALLHALTEAGGEVETDARVHNVVRAGNGFECALADRPPIRSSRLILATGAPNLPQLGGEYPDLAAALGHTPGPRFPALVPVTVAEAWPRTLAGLWMDVDLRLYSGRHTLAESTGSMLFTSGALTGEAVFNISREVEPGLARGEELELAVNFHPGMERDDVREWLRRVFGERTREHSDTALDFIVPRRLGEAMLEHQKVKPGARVMQLSESQREGLLREMTDTRLCVTGTLGMRAAESATGGINVREVDPRSFASKLTPGLYVVGRALDVSADWGGFEQHFALASGRLAGISLPQ
ncbi:MAG: aminoacetone oxidase family FAD-binding enzyme [Planctomycetes bacterium]|nr:aminoacetone oxidase family FAD-binding enzyme [Planctomycetota bacterium]